MQLYTIGQKYSQGKIVHIKCIEDDKLTDINIKNRSFLLLILEEGLASFSINKDTFTASAPCFVCFNEKSNPVVLKKERLKCNSIYFHPQFINVNMKFEFIRANDYGDFAFNHDLFLLDPFMSGNCVVPILHEYEDRIKESFCKTKHNLEHQQDILWSCRARSYFMEMIIIVERLNDIQKRQCNIPQEIENSESVKKALAFIENHYNQEIELADIIRAAETNHTTLSRLFSEELNASPIKYLWCYRINIAKKHLAFTDIPLKEIASRCGFKTISHFSRVFKEQTGKPPLIYRKTTVEERKNNIPKH